MVSDVTRWGEEVGEAGDSRDGRSPRFPGDDPYQVARHAEVREGESSAFRIRQAFGDRSDLGAATSRAFPQ